VRVRAGHDRPLFGLSRFERHCGSRSKKWRTSLRVLPGSCPEVALGEMPMALGTWLGLKGLAVGPRQPGDSDSEVPALGVGNSTLAQHKRARYAAGEWPGGAAYLPPAPPPPPAESLLMGPAELEVAPSADGDWLLAQQAAFNAAAAGGPAERHGAVLRLAMNIADGLAAA
jgi:hypothetical protein